MACTVIAADDDRAIRESLERAVGNLMENAAKFGLGTDDLGRIFRSDASRSLPGSGLGLAIVAGIAEVHGGTTFARNRAGGGATIGFTIAANRLLPGC